MHTYVFKITEELDGERIDKALGSLVDSLSRSFIQKFIKDGKVTVNNVIVKASYKVSTDDEVVFVLPEAVEPDIPAENPVFHSLLPAAQILF